MKQRMRNVILLITIIILATPTTIARPFPGRVLSGEYEQSGSRRTGSVSKHSGSAVKNVPPGGQADGYNALKSRTLYCGSRLRNQACTPDGQGVGESNGYPAAAAAGGSGFNKTHNVIYPNSPPGSIGTKHN
ncbi:hypothetical protein LINPERHAP2_LOCUS29756 [Linum perenne]